MKVLTASASATNIASNFQIISKDHSELLIDGYTRDVDKILDQIIPSSINDLCFSYYYTQINADSKILKINEKIMLARALEMNNNISYKWKLLFRGSRDGFEYKSYKDKCVGIN